MHKMQFRFFIYVNSKDSSNNKKQLFQQESLITSKTNQDLLIRIPFQKDIR